MAIFNTHSEYTYDGQVSRTESPVFLSICEEAIEAESGYGKVFANIGISDLKLN